MIELIIAFGAGLISFLYPCVLNPGLQSYCYVVAVIVCFVHMCSVFHALECLFFGRVSNRSKAIWNQIFPKGAKALPPPSCLILNRLKLIQDQTCFVEGLPPAQSPPVVSATLHDSMAMHCLALVALVCIGSAWDRAHRPTLVQGPHWSESPVCI